MYSYSVLMSVYFKEKAENLRQAIQSMLDQTIPPTDFVIVCDGPLTTELDSVIESFAREDPQLFQVIRLQENQGLGAALASGVKICRCELVARMDSDDIAVPDRMENQLRYFADDKELSVIGGQIAEFIGQPENITGYRKVVCSCEEIRAAAAFRNPMNHVTVTFRKTHILAEGNYQSLIGFEDYYLWARLLAAGRKLMNIENVCCLVRTDSMFSRRGGIQYFKHTAEMQRHLRELHLVSAMQYYRNLFVRFVGTVFVPTGLRGLLFKQFMRKKAL